MDSRRAGPLPSLESTRPGFLRALRRNTWRRRRADWRGTLARALKLSTRDYQATFVRFRGWPDWIRPALEALPPRFITEYSLGPEVAHWLAAVLAARRPTVIVECGSGISTVLIGLVLRHQGYAPGDVVFHSLEGERRWLETTRAAAAQLDVDAYARMHHTPIVPHAWSGGQDHAFDLAAVDGLAAVDLLLIDAPPAAFGRRGVLPSLAGSLAEGALVLLDDAARDEEQEAVDAWVDAGIVRLLGYAPVGGGLAAMEAP